MHLLGVDEEPPRRGAVSPVSLAAALLRSQNAVPTILSTTAAPTAPNTARTNGNSLVEVAGYEHVYEALESKPVQFAPD
jgi:hypothetical protein